MKLSAELRAEHAQMMTQMEGQVNIVKQVVADQDQQLKSAIEELKLIKASTTTMSEQVDLRKTEMDTQMQAADSKLDELRIAQAQAIASLATQVDMAFSAAQGKLDSHVAQIVAHCETQLAQIREDVDRSVAQGASTGGQSSRQRGLMLPKECPVDRLSQGVSKGDFKHWVKTVENFLESHQAFKPQTSCAFFQVFFYLLTWPFEFSSIVLSFRSAV